jgi:hypothetical protein
MVERTSETAAWLEPLFAERRGVDDIDTLFGVDTKKGFGVHTSERVM